MNIYIYIYNGLYSRLSPTFIRLLCHQASCSLYLSMPSPHKPWQKKYSSKSRTMKENLVLPKSGKGTKVAAKIMVSMTDKTRAISNSESLNSARSAKHCSHLHCRNPQDERSKGCRHAEVEDSKSRFVDDLHPTILSTSYQHYFHRKNQQEDWSEPHKEDLQSNGRRWRIG